MRVRVLILLCVFSSIGVFTPVTYGKLTTSQASQQLREAFSLRQQKSYDQAIELLEELSVFDRNLEAEFPSERLTLSVLGELAAAHYGKCRSNPQSQPGDWRKALDALEEYTRWLTSRRPHADLLTWGMIAKCREELAKLGSLTRGPMVVAKSRYVTGPVAQSNDRLLVPAAELAQRLGVLAKAGSPGQVELASDAHSLLLSARSRQAVLDGATITLPVAPVMVAGKLLVPLRFVAEAFGHRVDWEPLPRIAWVR